MPNKKIGVELSAEGQQEFTGAMQRAQKSVEDFGKKAGDTANHLSNFGSKAGGAITHVGNLGSAVGGAVGHLGNMGKAALDAAEKLAKIGIAAGVAGAAVTTAFGGKSVKLFGDYQEQLNMLQANTGASDEQMKEIDRTAKALGADLTLPATSAKDAGEAMLELSKAGLSVDDTLSAAKGVLQLSAAGHLSNARAAEIAANALNTFGLSGDKATEVANMLAAAANASSVEVTDLSDGFKMAASVFSSFQGPAVGAEGAMTELTAALGILGNAGIKGSDAGTSLKQMLLQLTGPSDKAKAAMQQLAQRIGVSGDIAFDSTGKMRPLKEIIDLTAKSTKGMTDEQRDWYITTIFGADASRAMIALMDQGADGFDKMTASVTKANAAQDMANSRMKGVKGAIEGLKSQVETLSLLFGESLAPFVEKATRKLSDFVGKIIDDFPMLEGKVKLFLIPIRDHLIPAFQHAEDAAKTFISAFKGDWSDSSKIDTLSRIFGNLGLVLHDKVIPGVKEFIDKIKPYAKEIGDVVTAFSPLNMVLDTLKGFLSGGLSGAIDGFIGHFTDFGNAIKDLVGKEGPKILEKLSEWGDAFVKWIGPAIPRAINELGNMTVSILNWMKKEAPKFIEGLAQWGKAFFDWAKTVVPDIIKALGDFGGKIMGWIGDNAPAIVESLKQWTQSFVGWVTTDFIPTMADWWGKVGDEAGRIIAEQGPKVGTALAGWEGTVLNPFGTMVGDKFRDIFKERAVQAIIDARPDLEAETHKNFQAIMQGVDKGISDFNVAVEGLNQKTKLEADKMSNYIGGVTTAADLAKIAMGAFGDKAFDQVQKFQSLNRELDTLNKQTNEAARAMNEGQQKLNVMDGIVAKMPPEVQALWKEWQSYAEKANEGGIAQDKWNTLAEGARAKLVELNPKLADITTAYTNQQQKVKDATQAYEDNTVKAALLETKLTTVGTAADTAGQKEGELARQTADAAKSAMSAAGDWNTLGANLAGGFIAGMAGKIKEAADTAARMAQAATAAAKANLKQASPSKVFEEIGQNVVKGFVNGIQGDAPQAEIAIGDMLNPVVEQAKALADEAAKTGHDIPNDMSFYMQASKGVLAGTMADLTNTVKKAFGEMSTVSHNLGDELPESLVMGAKGSLGPFQGALDDIVKAAKRAAQDANAALGSISLAGGGSGGIKHETDVQPFGAGGIGRAEAPHFAGGGYMKRTGWAWVGENGPEMAWLGAGSRVFNADDSRRAVAPPATAGQIYNSASYSYSTANSYNLTVNSALQSSGVVNDFHLMRTMSL